MEILTVIAGNKLLSGVAGVIGAGLVVRYRNYLMINLVDWLAPKALNWLLVSFVGHLNTYFEEKKRNSKYSEVWADGEKQLIIGFRAIADTLEK